MMVSRHTTRSLYIAKTVCTAILFYTYTQYTRTLSVTFTAPLPAGARLYGDGINVQGWRGEGGGGKGSWIENARKGYT